jgi:hypothetical protein
VQVQVNRKHRNRPASPEYIHHAVVVRWPDLTLMIAPAGILTKLPYHHRENQEILHGRPPSGRSYGHLNCQADETDSIKAKLMSWATMRSRWGRRRS